jgi:hypothetical protein
MSRNLAYELTNIPGKKKRTSDKIDTAGIA